MATLLGEGHARRMDGIYASQRHIYDLTRKYYLLGRDLLVRDLAVPVGGSVLEIGCGTGRNLALVARHYPNARLHGLDISAEMLKSAQASLGRKGLAIRVALAQGDATAFDPHALFGEARFDRIFCSYTLSMIPDWQAAIAMASQCLAPGGELHIVDFGQQAALPSWFRKGLHRWLAHFHVTPRAMLFWYCRELAAEQGLQVETRSLYRDYAWSVVLRA